MRAKTFKLCQDLSEDYRISSDVDFAFYLSNTCVDGFTFLSKVSSRNFFQHINAGLPSTFVPIAALRNSDGVLSQTYT